MIRVSLDNLTLKCDQASFKSVVPELVDAGWEIVNDVALVFKISRDIGGQSQRLRGIYMAPYRFTADNCGVRVEFNPNYIPVETVSNMLRDIYGVKTWEITRVDVAWDLLDEYPMTDFVVDKPRVKRNIIQSSTGRLQTLYLGASSSEKQVRIYDKLQERKDAGDAPRDVKSWWRVEAQMRSATAKAWQINAREILPIFVRLDQLSSTDRLIALGFMNGEDLSFLGTKKLRTWRSRCGLNDSGLRAILLDVFNSSAATLEKQVELVTSKLASDTTLF